VPGVEEATPTPSQLIDYVSTSHQRDLMSAASGPLADESDGAFSTRQRETVAAYINAARAAAQARYPADDPGREETLEHARQVVASFDLPTPGR
jgi:hypothetical protein